MSKDYMLAMKNDKGLKLARSTDSYINKNTAPVFLIGLIVLLTSIISIPVSNEVENRRLNNSGTTTYGQVIGIWQIPKQLPFAIYMFPVDSIYYTGTFPFPHEWNVKEGDEIQVIYLRKKPDINRCVDLVVN